MRKRIVGKIQSDGMWIINVKLCYNKKLYTKEITFMIDSGAQETVLSNLEAKELMGIGFDDLPEENEISIEGFVDCKARPLLNPLIVFSEELMEPCARILILDPNKFNKRANLIGRDILNQYNVVTNMKHRQVTLIRLEDNYFDPADCIDQ
jgi:hypothetical protein